MSISDHAAPSEDGPETSGNYRGRVVQFIQSREFYTGDKFKLLSFVPDAVSANQCRAVLKAYRGVSFASDRRQIIQGIFQCTEPEHLERVSPFHSLTRRP